MSKSVIFAILISDLFQIKRKAKGFLELENEPRIWQRSKLDPIVYNTRDYRDFSTSCLKDSKTFRFSSPRSDPPQIATGITSLNFNSINRVRLIASVSKITREDFQVNLDSYNSTTVKHGAGCTFFEVSQTDPDFQQGKVITFIPSKYPDGHEIYAFPIFAWVFAEDVTVVTWFYQIDVGCFSAGYLDIYTESRNVSREGFVLLYGATQKSQNNLLTLGSTWIAYPKHKPGIDSGRIDKIKFGLVRAANESEGTLTNKVKFKKLFKKPPQVWLALCGIHMTWDDSDDMGDNLRLVTQVVKDSITTTGFKYDIISWGEAVLETVSLCWLAVELD